MGMLGHGDAFYCVIRNGIRPAYYYYDDEVVVAASERPAIMTAFDVPFQPGERTTPDMHRSSRKERQRSSFVASHWIKSLQFERIYFSRGAIRDLKSGRCWEDSSLPKVLEAVHYDYDHTIFSFIPNTAEVAFYGMMKGLEDHLKEIKKKKLLELEDKTDATAVESIPSMRPRVEKLAIRM